MAKKIRFSLNISSQDMMKYYRGDANVIATTSDQGLKLQLPVINFRQYITDIGLNGHFEMELDENNKLLTLTKIA